MTTLHKSMDEKEFKLQLFLVGFTNTRPLIYNKGNLSIRLILRANGHKYVAVVTLDVETQWYKNYDDAMERIYLELVL